MALAQVKAGNASENSLNEIRQENIIKRYSEFSIDIIKMDTILMNPEKSKKF